MEDNPSGGAKAPIEIASSDDDVVAVARVEMSDDGSISETAYATTRANLKKDDPSVSSAGSSSTSSFLARLQASPFKRQKKNKTTKKPKEEFAICTGIATLCSPDRVKFGVTGTPRAKKRVGLSRKGTHFWNRSRDVEKKFSESVTDFLQDSYGRVPTMGSRDFKIELSFCFAGQKRNVADLDNLVKLVLDAFNGVLYDDDSQVMCLVATKRFGNEHGGNGYTVVDITAM